MKRVSLLIQSKKYPGQTTVGYALLHEFNPKRLSFFSSQKFPVDDELEVTVDFFGTKGHMKVLMTHIHEQISSGRVMNGIPNEENPFPVRKFYRCYAAIKVLEGLLPGMTGPAEGASAPAANADKLAVAPAAEAGGSANVAPAAEAPADSDVVPSKEPPPSLVSEGSSAPADSADMAAKLAALSNPPAEEKQAA